MDTNLPPADDLNDLERRLAAWQPAAQGLDAERMLFDAGRASVPRNRWVWAWPALCGCLAVATGVLGLQLSREHTDRLVLQEQVRQAHAAALARREVVPTPDPSETTNEQPLAPDSYLVARRSLTEDPDGWLPEEVHRQPSGEPLTMPPSLRAWPVDRSFNP